MAAAPLRPSTSPSQYSSTVLPSGFSVPMPVTTTRLPSRLIAGTNVPFSRPASLPQRPPNLTDEVGLDRLLGDSDRVLHGAGVRATVCDHGNALDAEKWGTAELAPVHAGTDAADFAPNQETPGLARQRSRDLVAHRPEDQVGGGFGHLDGDVAHEPVGHDHVCPAGQYVFGLHVADELELAVATPEPGRGLTHPLIALALLLTVAEQGNRGVGPAEHLLGVDRAHLSELHQELGAGIDVGAHVEEVGRLRSSGQDGAEGRTVDASNPALYEKRGRHDGSRVACRHPGRRFTVLAQACADVHRRVGLGADRLRRVVVHLDHLAGWNEAQAWVGVEQALDPVGQADHDNLDTEVLNGFRGAEHGLLGSEVTPHAVDRDA